VVLAGLTVSVRSHSERKAALAIGYRIPVSFAEAFPYGAYAVGAVEEVINFDVSTKESRIQARDKESGLLVWQIEAFDADPEARKKSVKVKIAARVAPVLPEPQAGSPFRAVEFEDLSVTPYVVEGTPPRVAYSYRASGLRAPKAAPRPVAAGSGA
jgi:hypothetical protein